MSSCELIPLLVYHWYTNGIPMYIGIPPAPATPFGSLHHVELQNMGRKTWSNRLFFVFFEKHGEKTWSGARQENMVRKTWLDGVKLVILPSFQENIGTSLSLCVVEGWIEVDGWC